MVSQKAWEVWNILEHLGTFWNILVLFGTFWHFLEYVAICEFEDKAQKWVKLVFQPITMALPTIREKWVATADFFPDVIRITK